MGNRVWKQTSDGVNTTSRKYIVDISGKLPTILCEIDAADSSLKKSYVYADAQVLAQREYTVPGDPNFYDEQFYVHDRLGSVRLVVAATVDAQTQQIDGVETVNCYTYTPFGSFYDGECQEAETAGVKIAPNPWRFTGQYHDAEINQYHLRARQYDPTLMRFTSRDPVRGGFAEPLTLHKYLYSLNSPIDNVDPSGKVADRVTGALVGAAATHAAGISLLTYGVATGNDDLMEIGLALEASIPVGMAAGAIIGPNVPAIKMFVVQHAASIAVTLDVAAVFLGDPTMPNTPQGQAFSVLKDILEQELGWSLEIPNMFD